MTRGAAATTGSVMGRMVLAGATRRTGPSVTPGRAFRHPPATEVTIGPRVQSSRSSVTPRAVHGRRRPPKEPPMVTATPVTDRPHKAAKRYIYAWGEGSAEGDGNMKDLLGG